MSIQWTTPGFGHVGEYQLSGHAFAVPQGNGTQVVNLNYVSRAITVSAAGADATVTFHDDDGGTSVFTFGAAGNIRFEVRCKKITISGGSSVNVSAVIELTNIPANTNAPIPKMGDLAIIS